MADYRRQADTNRHEDAIARFVSWLRGHPAWRDRIVHHRYLEPRPARYDEPDPPLPQPLQQTLADLGIARLYTHQVQALATVRAGGNPVIVTGTASGKTLCYNLPTVERLLADPQARALYIFPTKALAQDQARGLVRLISGTPELKDRVRVGVYDGDTPTDTRRRLRDQAQVILTNPDMLHQGILPYHSRWAKFFGNLRLVVVDEVHSYRGIFGSHVANVLRRLERICRHYEAEPTYICCSATIANPQELASRLTGRKMDLIADDGSPRGGRHFLLWNPPVDCDCGCLHRASSSDEATDLAVECIRRGIPTIAFTRTRMVAELIHHYASERLAREEPDLSERVKPYRAGYLPEERREIERQLFSGELLGVVSTNALELGIDVGGLDASIIVGYPGTIASTWQQAGRAGRGAGESLVIMVAYNEPLDQYLMRHPAYIFERSPEHGIINPANPYVLAGHLRCAAFELPLREEDGAYFGPEAAPIQAILEEVGQVKRLGRDYYWSSTDYPAAQTSLRTVSDNTFTIMERNAGNRVIGVVDAISAPELVYPGGVYLHQGETYLVRELDLEGRAAYVERQQLDYYTQAILDSKITVQGQEMEKHWPGCRVCHGEAAVSWQTTGYKKIKFYSLDSIGYGRLDLPRQSLETASTWLIPDTDLLGEVRRQGRDPVEGLNGIRNVAVHVLALLAMCDRQDLGGMVDSSNTGSPTIFLYDRYPGGLGFVERGYELVGELLEECLRLISECGCQEGCPSCTGSPVTRPAQHADPDLGRGYPIPDKEAALVILHRLLGGDYLAAPRAAAEPDIPVTSEIKMRVRQARKPQIGL